MSWLPSVTLPVFGIIRASSASALSSATFISFKGGAVSFADVLRYGLKNKFLDAPLQTFDTAQEHEELQTALSLRPCAAFAALPLSL